MTTETKIECSSCGNEVEDDDLVGDECYDCYKDSLTDCQICGEGFEDSEISPFILVKTEFAETGNRIPGIYRVRRRPFMTSGLIGSSWLHGDDLLFIDQLPEPDAHWDISGNICNECSQKNEYARIDQETYGQNDSTKRLSELEQKRVLEVVSAHPKMLRDLETDELDEDLQRWCQMPSDLPTYHPRLFCEHQGVCIYWTSERYANWLTLRPEPSFRGRYDAGLVFAPTGLSTWEKIPLDPNRAKDRCGNYYDTGYRYGHEHDYLEAARSACIRAIEQGLITKTHAPEDAR